MKKLILLLVIGLVMSFAVLGFAIEEPINKAIADSSWTAVSLSADQTCTAYAVQARTSAAFKVSNSSTGTKYWTVPADGILSITARHTGPGNKVLFYAQSASGAVTLEVFLVKGN